MLPSVELSAGRVESAARFCVASVSLGGDAESRTFDRLGSVMISVECASEHVQLGALIVGRQN